MCQYQGQRKPPKLMRILLLAVAITTSLSYTFPHHLPNSVALYERKKGKKGKTSVGGFGGLIKNIKQQQFSFTGSITPGMQTVQNPTPPTLPPSSIPEYAKSSHPLTIDDVRPWIVTPKTPEQISKMEISGRIARQVLDFGGSLVRPGITTDEIDQAVHELTIELGAYPSPLNYHKFPKSCCTSVNEIVCHGIPDDRKLVAGDIINLDITIYNDGYHGDCSEMFIVGERSDVPKRSQELIQATYDCWLLACKFVKPGNLYRDIGEIIEDYVTEKQFSTVKGFCGHGIGSIFHCNPNILHYKNDQPNGR